MACWELQILHYIPGTSNILLIPGSVSWEVCQEQQRKALMRAINLVSFPDRLTQMSIENKNMGIQWQILLEEKLDFFLYNKAISHQSARVSQIANLKRVIPEIKPQMTFKVDLYEIKDKV